jgi:DNA polymerase/3'-5' exonuclease PolX
MTPDQIDRSIAESISAHFNCGTVIERDYYTSLDACAEFEKTLPGDAVDYCKKLCEVTGADPHDRVFLCREVITAKAPQRCEAYLKFMNKWREA